jgi:hypothetical protein
VVPRELDADRGVAHLAGARAVPPLDALNVARVTSPTTVLSKVTLAKEAILDAERHLRPWAASTCCFELARACATVFAGGFSLMRSGGCCATVAEFGDFCLCGLLGGAAI